MIIKHENQNIENSLHNINNNELSSINENQINQSINDINERNNEILQRGFNRFLNYGITIQELHLLRFLFHSAMYQQARIRGIEFEWSVQSMIEREENWLRSQVRNNNNNNINRGRYLTLLVRNDFDNNNLRRRRIYNYEPNFCFFQGLVIGFLLNIFTILFLIIFRFRPKFKMGLQIGMIFGICILVIPYLFVFSV
jgi:hypothetical protein